MFWFYRRGVDPRRGSEYDVIQGVRRSIPNALVDRGCGMDVPIVRAEPCRYCRQDVCSCSNHDDPYSSSRLSSEASSLNQCSGVLTGWWL